MHTDLDICIDVSCKPFENHIRYSYNILLKEVLEIREGIPIQFVYGGSLAQQGSPDKATIHIIPSDFFSEGKYLSSNSLPIGPILWFDAEVPTASHCFICDSKLPVLFASGGKKQLYVKHQDNVMTTNADFIASAFFMLTRYEEIVSQRTDQHGRFPLRDSLAYKEGFHHRPLVNEYAELIWNWIITLVPQARRKKKTYQIRLTHDVDQVRKYGTIPRELRIGASLAIKYQRPWKAINHLTGLMKTRLGYCKDPYDSYDELMDISEQLGGTGCFYFMAEDTESRDKRYEVTSRDVVNVIENILKRGHDIGLHPGLGSYLSPEKLFCQKEKLDKVLGYCDYGGRQHYLQWKAPDTWCLYEQAGLTHDSSVGYAEIPGFRCGICMPFYVFDARAGRRLNLKEIPLIAMDTSLFSKKYNNADGFEIKANLLTSIKENIKKISGIYCLLWHNTYNHKQGTAALRNLIND